MIHVVAGLIVDKAGRILIAKRPNHKHYPGYWEFPGGKLEANETPYQTLCRELKEELGIEVLQAKDWLKFEHNYPTQVILLDIWLVSQFAGEAVGCEGQQVEWASREQFKNFDFLPANQTIISHLMQKNQLHLINEQ